MAGFTAVIGLGLSVLGAVNQRKEAKEQKKLARQQADEQRQQAELERRRADIANARTLRANLRSARIARGEMTNVAGSAGLTGSSGFQGGMGSLESQQAANVGFFQQGQQFNEASFQNQVDTAEIGARMGASQARSMQAGALGSFGSMMLQDSGGFRQIAKTGKRLFGLV